MTKTTSAVWVVLGFFLLMAGTGWAEMPAANEEGQLAEAEEFAESLDVPVLTPRAKVEARIAEVKDLPLPELQELLEKTEAALPAMNQQMQQAGRAAQEARETAADESQEIQDLYAQIRALHHRIAALTEELPAVREKTDALAEIRGDLLGEMDFRTQLIKLIRQKKAADAAAAAAEELP